MMIDSAVSRERGSVIKTPYRSISGEGDEAMKAARIAKNKKNDPASTFSRSQLSDYDEKKLNPLQKSIMNIQEQISKVRENEELDAELKDELLGTLNKQLDELTKQLAEEPIKQQEEDEKAEKKKKKKNDAAAGTTDNEKSAEDKQAESLISMGSGLDRIKSLHGEAETLKGKAGAAQRELDYAVNHPVPGKPEESSLRLHDKVIIAKKQGEINDLTRTAKKELGEIGDILNEQRAQLKDDADSDTLGGEPTEKKQAKE